MSHDNTNTKNINRMNRSRSNSPANSLDSSLRRRSLSNSRKKLTKSMLKSKEDVQVFTSLPPKVDGEIKCYLRFKIPKINYIIPETNQGSNQSYESKSKKAPYPNREKYPLIKPPIKDLPLPTLPSILAKCFWWGEDQNSHGAVFRPKIFTSSNDSFDKNNRKSQTTAKYMVRSGPKQFQAYLNDMKTLDIDLIKEDTMESIGKVQLHEIQQLTFANPIKGYYSAFDKNQTKIGEVYLSLQLEELTRHRDDSVESNASRIRVSDMSIDENEKPKLDRSNINDFNSKNELFEQDQLKKNLKNDSKFYSESYVSHGIYDESILKNDNLKNPLIKNLIERGNKLKNEMLKSSSKSAVSPPQVHSSNFNYLNSLVNLEDNYDFIDSDTNEFVSTDDGIHDFSGLLTDPDLLSALWYTQTSEKPSTYEKLNDYDQELEDLLQPKTLRSKTNKPNKNIEKRQNESKIKEKLMIAFKSKEENHMSKIKAYFHDRNRSLDVSSNGSLVSETDENEKSLTNENRRNNSFGRVSFELQSSDGESGFNSLTNTLSDKCTEILSPQRLSLLNLIQVAKLKIEKINLFSTHNASAIISRVNKIEQQNQRDESKTTNKSTKPPIPCSPTNGRKNEAIGQAFFIEYQFPVTANTRESEETNNSNANALMATQIMRVNTSKRYSSMNTEENLIFENLADYSVLFNSYSLETWWKSAILFKVYCRPSIMTSSTQPYLVGISKLDLKNVLKSRNFRLYKKIAIYDQLTNGAENKRIGTLHIKIELWSDIKEFNNDLRKLKNSEAKLLSSKAKITKKNKSLQNSNTKTKDPSTPPLVSKLGKNVIEEFSLPIQMFLSINEGRGFGDILKQKNLNQSANIFLICRLFWNKEKVKFDVENYRDLHFSWTLNLSLMIKPSMIENMRNNFMIIEAWEKNEKKDSFIGTVKLPLNEFYLRFKDLKLFRQLLKDDSLQPSIGVDGWIGACDPFTGKKAGEINVLLAMGSNEQILNLQKMLFDKVRLKQNISNFTHEKEEILAKRLTEHKFTIKLDNLKLHPRRNTSKKSEPLPNEADCFIKYIFPTGKYKDEKDSTHFDFEMHSLSSRVNQMLESKQEHTLTLNSTESLSHELLAKFRTFYKLDTYNPVYIYFEVWSRTYYPNCRDQLIAKGELSLEKLISIVDNAKIGLNNRSFVLPLILAKNEPNLDEIDKFIGQLFLTIDYCVQDINHKIPKPFLNSLFNKQELYASLSIGVLRATGLQIAFGNSKDSPFSPNENSSVFVKFSLNFLNKPQESKITRSIIASLNGFSPEFFDYFDIKCPLVSTYNSNNKRALSLAEQIEMGQIIFEIWSKSNDLKSNDTLLGTSVVPLESLLDNRIGIRGWFPIKPFLNYSANVLENILKNESNVGGIEIAIRFTKADDFLRIINAAKDIGWIRASDLESSNQPVKIVKNTSVKNNMSENFLKNSRQTIKCIIEIEKAVHLQNIFDENSNKNSPPNSFITFSISLSDPSEIAQTSVCEKNSSPSWNYQLMVNVDSEYFIEDGKSFLFKVWHKSMSNTNKLLGYVTVDLQPLIFGLNCISGWYNIQDSVGNSQGQLKINIMPQESLFALKQLHDSNKKLRIVQPNTNFNSSFNRFNFATSGSQTTISQTNGIQATESTFSIAETTSNLMSSHSSIGNLTSLEIFRQKESKSDLRLGLMKKLTELDELNKNLKERLDKKALKQDDQVKEINNALNETPVKLIVEETNVKETQEENIEIEDFSFQDNLEDLKKNVQSISKINLDKSEPINQCDSFWIEPVENNEIEEKNLNEDLNLELSSKHSEKETSQMIYSDFANQKFNEDEFSSEINEIKSNDLNVNGETRLQEKIDLNDENANDTDLDQTFNLNGSYEISPTKIESPFEIVDKIIDCSEFDNQDENEIIDQEPNENKNDQPNHDDNYIGNNTIVFLQTTTTIITTDVQVNQEEPTNNQDNEDNLTIIVPEELNKINLQNEEKEVDFNEINSSNHTKEVTSAPKTDVCARFKELSSKLPNYFLAQKELEISMKQVHKNFNKMNMLDQNGESKNESTDESKIKSKDLLFKNENFLKQDFDRINKIFHSKFS